MPKTETILFCPLNWGLGHATRIVPLVNKAFGDGHRVIIAAEGNPLRFLENEFPDIETIKLKGYRIRYWQKPFFNLGLFLQLPLFYISIWQERFLIKRIVKAKNASTIISDNRYGLYCKGIKSILITHQIFIKAPKAFKWAEPFVHKQIKGLIENFDECWVPDYEEEERSLSGELSHGNNLPKNAKYVGPLSRFQNMNPEKETKPTNIPDVLVLISGPEPLRTHFEKEVENRHKDANQNVLMVCGKPKKQTKEEKPLLTKVSHLSTVELYWYLKECKEIISRSGYSTIMDLHALNREAELTPTPGQTEQEYLFKYRKT